jgi:hypothetical protein
MLYGLIGNVYEGVFCGDGFLVRRGVRLIYSGCKVRIYPRTRCGVDSDAFYDYFLLRSK